MDHRELKNEQQIVKKENTSSMKVRLNHSGKLIKPWTNQEMQIIVDSINNFNYKTQSDHVLELMQHLPDRSFSATYAKLTFMRTQQKITRSYWSQDQIQTFKQAYEQYGTNWSLICEKYSHQMIKEQEDCKENEISVRIIDSDEEQPDVQILPDQKEQSYDKKQDEFKNWGLQEKLTLIKAMFEYTHANQTDHINQLLVDLPRRNFKLVSKILTLMRRKHGIVQSYGTEYIADQYLKQKLIDDAIRIANYTVKRWSQEELDKLRSQLDKLDSFNSKEQEEELCKLFNKRTKSAILHKIRDLRQLATKPWSQDEMQKLWYGFEQYGSKWQAIRNKLLPNRLPIECAEQIRKMQQQRERKLVIQEQVKYSFDNIQREIQVFFERSDNDQYELIAKHIFEFEKQLLKKMREEKNHQAQPQFKHASFIAYYKQESNLETLQGNLIKFITKV